MTPYLVDEGPGNAGMGAKVFFIWGGCCVAAVIWAYFVSLKAICQADFSSYQSSKACHSNRSTSCIVTRRPASLPRTEGTSSRTMCMTPRCRIILKVMARSSRWSIGNCHSVVSNWQNVLQGLIGSCCEVCNVATPNLSPAGKSSQTQKWALTNNVQSPRESEGQHRPSQRGSGHAAQATSTQDQRLRSQELESQRRSPESARRTGQAAVSDKAGIVLTACIERRDLNHLAVVSIMSRHSEAMGWNGSQTTDRRIVCELRNAKNNAYHSDPLSQSKSGE